MNFLERIFARLDEAGSATVLQEIRGQQFVPASGNDLLLLVAKAREFIVATGLKRGDRCALLAPNSIRWAALDLALMAEGIIVVPLYARQAPAELAVMARDCGASRICCENAVLRDALLRAHGDAPPISLFAEVFASATTANAPPMPAAPADPVTIIYTSGTSGEPKGAVLNMSNIDFMLS
ncbi:MAG TPA: AMP-binding protein, partial [Candidatus Acidoferrales bacterium]|nr:AMP-binding protein [Candidatus Acidoferrales bacterium]